MTERPVAWIGIDAGKRTHHAAAVDEAGRLCWSQKVPNDQAAIEELIARAAGTAAEVRWAVDLGEVAHPHRPDRPFRGRRGASALRRSGK